MPSGSQPTVPLDGIHVGPDPEGYLGLSQGIGRGICLKLIVQGDQFFPVHEVSLNLHFFPEKVCLAFPP